MVPAPGEQPSGSSCSEAFTGRRIVSLPLWHHLLHHWALLSRTSWMDPAYSMTMTEAPAALWQ